MPGGKWEIASYDYRDERGELLYQVVRYEPKGFRQRVPDGAGGWTWSTKDVRRVLYRLPELLVSKGDKTWVFVVEGEKDADRLASLDLIATTNAGGAKAPWADAYTEALRGRRVVLLPDNDPVGWDRVKDIARELRGKATTVRIVALPDLPEHGDVSDWLNAGGNCEELLALVRASEGGRRKEESSDALDSSFLLPPSSFRVLDGNPNGIIFPADERSGWARGMSQDQGGKGDDRQHWLSIWSGVQSVCNRVRLPEPVIIDDPFVSVVGGIQPDALGDLIDDAREDGFAARLLFRYPDPVAHQNWSEDTVAEAAAYADLCESLWKLELATAPVVLSKEAKARWVEWVNQHRQEEPPDNLRPAWSKAEGHSLRLALVLHLARRAAGETKATERSLASVEGAIKLIGYFDSHAGRVHGRSAAQKDQGRIGNALRWVRRQVAAGKKVTARLVQMKGVCKDSDEAKKLLRDLEELGHGTVTEQAQGSVVFRLAGPTDPTPNAPTGLGRKGANHVAK